MSWIKDKLMDSNLVDEDSSNFDFADFDTTPFNCRHSQPIAIQAIHYPHNLTNYVSKYNLSLMNVN